MKSYPISDLFASFRETLNAASAITQLFLSLIVIVIAVLLIRVIASYYRRSNHGSPDARRVGYIAVRNIIATISVIVVIFIWAGELRTFALSVAALAAAVAIACKEFIMSGLGSLLRALQRLYGIGDIIEINGIRGEVLEVNFFTTLILEHGVSGYVTGRYQEFPNMLLLLHPVHKSAQKGLFGLEQLRVPLEQASDNILDAEQRLLQAGQFVCKSWTESASNHFRALEKAYLIELPEGRPIVIIEPIDGKRVDLVLRFPCPSGRRMKTSQDILRHYYRLLQHPQATLGTEYNEQGSV